MMKKTIRYLILGMTLLLLFSSCVRVGTFSPTEAPTAEPQETPAQSPIYENEELGQLWDRLVKSEGLSEIRSNLWVEEAGTISSSEKYRDGYDTVSNAEDVKAIRSLLLEIEARLTSGEVKKVGDLEGYDWERLDRQGIPRVFNNYGQQLFLGGEGGLSTSELGITLYPGGVKIYHVDLAAGRTNSILLRSASDLSDLIDRIAARVPDEEQYKLPAKEQ